MKLQNVSLHEATPSMLRNKQKAHDNYFPTRKTEDYQTKSIASVQSAAQRHYHSFYNASALSPLGQQGLLGQPSQHAEP